MFFYLTSIFLKTYILFFKVSILRNKYLKVKKLDVFYVYSKVFSKFGLLYHALMIVVNLFILEGNIC